MWVFLLVLSCISTVVSGDWTLNLEYSVDDWETAHNLGKMTLRPSFDGNYTGSFAPDASTSRLGDILETSNSQYYRIRATSSKNKEKRFLSTTRSCMMLRSKLLHYFWVSMDADSELTSVTVFPDNILAGVTWTSEEECVVESSTNNAVGTKNEVQGIVYVKTVGQLAVPDTQSFVEKIDRERKARQHGAGEDNRSFLAKYWMYIVPVVIFMVISSAMNPDGGS